MKITIAIPTFNSEKTLATCLSSIEQQTYRNFEVIVMDGVSTDATVTTAQSFSSRLPGLRVISEADKGIYDAMNKVIRISKGEWIYFLGSDDTFHNASVLERISVFLDSGAQVIYGNIDSPRFNGIYGRRFSRKRILTQNISHQAIFFRRDLFSQIGIFNLAYKAHADWDHNMRWVLDSGIRKMHVNIVIANYADGGYSSIHGDSVFHADKILKYLEYSRNSLPFLHRLRIYLSYQKANIRGRKYKIFLRYLFIWVKLIFK